MPTKSHVYKGTPWQSQLRDSKGNIVAIFPGLGSGYTTNRSSKQNRRLAFKIARLLNGGTK